MLTEKELLYIEETAYRLSDWTISHRRNLHRIPEPAWTEKKTTAYLARELKQLGYTIINGEAVAGHETGLIAELCISNEPVFGLRFDIDGLPVDEARSSNHLPSAEDFCSTHEGAMHACGHDGHMAIGLTTARILIENRDRIKGTVRIIFQPAEEGCRGAREVVKAGWLQNVRYFLAGHIVGRDYGQTVSGAADCVTGVNGSLATTKMNTTFSGHSCHGACPENGASAITALCNAVLTLNAIPRNSGGSTMINIGRISGGEGRNIVAAHSYMELEVRGETTELNQYMEDQALRIIDNAASLYGCTSETIIQGKAPSLVSSPDFREEINLILNKLKTVKLCTDGQRFRASEDASLMMEAVKQQGGQAAYMLFSTDTTAPLHSRNYDYDEAILPKAAAILSSIVLSYIGN